MPQSSKPGPKGPSRWTKTRLDRLAVRLEEWMEDPSNFWLGDFAIDVADCHRTYLADLAREGRSQKFSDTYKRAKGLQEAKIVKGALLGKLNPTMAIFTLKNVAGWRDVKAVEMDGGANPKTGHRLPVRIVVQKPADADPPS